MTVSMQPPISIEHDVFTENRGTTNVIAKGTALPHVTTGKEQSGNGTHRGFGGKNMRATVTFSPHARHHPYRSDARVSTSLRTIGRQGSYVYTPKGPERDPSNALSEPESPTRTPRASDQMIGSASTPKSILKRNRLVPIRVAASVEEGTRGNAEELRQSGRKTARPVLQVKDSFTINKERSNPLGNTSQNTLSGVGSGGNQGFREAEVPSSDHTHTSDEGQDGQGDPRGNQGDHDRSPGDDREPEDQDDGNPLDVEMVQLVSSPSTVDSLLEIILNELDDLLAVEDAYLLLFARLKKCFVINEDPDRPERSSEQQQEREDILRNVRAQTSEMVRALTRDIKRLVQPATSDTRFLRSSSPIPDMTEAPASPSPSPRDASGSDQEDTPRPRRQGYSEAEVRERRAAAGVGQAALKVLSFIGYHPELHGNFSEADLTSLLSTTLVIPATPKLNTPNSKRTYAFAIYVLSLLRVPTACLIPITSKVIRALLNATGEFGMQFWRGSQAKQEGPASGNVKAKMEGYSAIWNVCRYYPSVFLPYHKELIPEIIKGLVHANPQVRARASAAAGGFAKGKLTWIREAREAFRAVVLQGRDEAESDEQWQFRRIEAGKEWRMAKDVAAESEATTVQQLKRGSKAPYGQEGVRRMIVWDEVEKMLSQTMINDPHWSCASWACLVTLLGDGYINDTQRYKSMQQIILAPLSKQDVAQPSAGRVWLSRFAYDHTVYAVFHYKSQTVLTQEGLPGISYDLDYSLGDKMLGAAMSLVAEAWKREKELVRLKADAITVSSSVPEGNKSLVWKRLDTESSQTYLKACGSEIVGVLFAAVSCILNNVPNPSDTETTPEQHRSVCDNRLDQLWKIVEPILENMLAVRAVDWIKIEALKILCALTRRDSGNEIHLDRMDSLLHLGYLEGEIANIDIAPKGREQAILELAQSLAEKRVQPEEIPSLPSKWIASRFPRRLGRLFRQAFKGLYGLHDGSLVSELLENEPRLPEHLAEIWSGMLQAVAEVESDDVSYGQALLEIVSILNDIYAMSPSDYTPVGSLSSDINRLEKTKMAIWHELVSIVLRVLGVEALSTHKLSFPLLMADDGLLAGADEPGGTSGAGALLHTLTSCPPATLSSDAEIQDMYLDSIGQLVVTLGGGSICKRVLGNLTNTLANFHLNIPRIRKAIWRTLSAQWISVMDQSKGSSSTSNNTCRMLVELLVRPYRESWSADFTEEHEKWLFSVWQELLDVAISRSLSKGVNAAAGVYEPFALLMEEIKSEHGSARISSLMMACTAIFQNVQKGTLLPSSFVVWTLKLVRDACSLEPTRFKRHAIPLLAAIIQNIGGNGMLTTDQVEELGPALRAAITFGLEDLREHSEILPLCLDLLCRLKTAFERGQIPWDIPAIKAWSVAVNPLLASGELRYTGPCQEFWHVCHDKFRSDCFPEDQAKDISESLGLCTPSEEGDEAEVDTSFDLMMTTDDIDDEPVILSRATVYTCDYDADVSASMPTTQTSPEPQATGAERGLKRKAEDDPSSSSRRLRSHASQEVVPSPTGQKTRRQKKGLRRAHSQSLPNETPKRGKNRRLKATRSLTTPTRHALDDLDGDCIVVLPTPPHEREARISATTPRPDPSVTPTRGDIRPKQEAIESVITTEEIPSVVLVGAATEPSDDAETHPPARSTEAHFRANDQKIAGKLHVVIIATGSVASVKIPLMVEALIEDDRIAVQVVATKAALTFFTPNDVKQASDGRCQTWTDDEEWSSWKQMGDSILHIELRRWADIVLVAPCDANTLAKMAGGICDNLATSLLRALTPTTPTYVFPAMNTFMYEHPLTAHHVATIRDVIGYKVMGPQMGKKLACGDSGAGAMTDWREIVGIVKGRADDIITANAASTVEQVSA